MRMTVRGYFVLLVVAVILPALALSAFLVWLSAESQRVEQERVLQDYASTLTEVVDREVRTAAASLETLRHSVALQEGDIRVFEQVARRVHADNPHWLTILLTGPDGQQLMNLAAKPGEPLPNIRESPVIQEVLRGKLAVSDLLVGQVIQAHLLAVHVPVFIDGKLRYALGMSLRAEHLQGLVQRFPVSDDTITGLVDRQGIIIARSTEPEKGVGTPTAQMWMRDAPKGIVHGTGRIQIPVIGAYARSELTGWRTIVSVRAADFNEPRNRAIFFMSLGAAVVLGLGLGIALYLGGRVVGPLERLAREAARYVRGDASERRLRHDPIEVAELEASLREAGRLQRDAQSQLQHTREQLAQAQRIEAVGQLTGGVAHDFNNLLTIILGNLDAARRIISERKDEAHGRLSRSVENASQGAQRAAKLTSQLLAFSRRQPLEPKVLDVNRLLLHLERFLKPTLGETIHLEACGAAGLWAIEADDTQLESALVNLAVNARDAMPEGGKLTIEASNIFLDESYAEQHADVKPGQYVLISVTDSGVGMAEEVRRHAFDPFFTTKGGAGTGLGLSQAHGFVKQSGGHIKIYSEPRQGTTIHMYLPRSYATPTEEVQTQPTQPNGSETILVVEDDEHVRSFVCETLSEREYKVLSASDAESALRIIDQKPHIDLLLTDVVLPGLNGKQLSVAFEQRCPSARVLFMTGYSRNAIVHQGRLDPGVQLLQKPLTQTSLVAKVRRVLDLSKDT
jgi:signal transduction histidine kinase